MLFLLFICIISVCAENLVTLINESENYNFVRYSDFKILNDGNVIPLLTLGTFTPYQSIRNSGAIEQSVITAIESGYRHLDTAPFYYTEEDIGKAIINVTSRGIVTRQDLFITTKVDMRVNNTDGVIPSIRRSLTKLQLDYVDLCLIHFSQALGGGPDYNILALWRGLEEAQKEGLTVSIGVSNFNSSHINKILTYGNIRPAVNQIEVNPTYAELELAAYCQNQGIVVMSYAPFGYMVPRPWTHETLPPQFDDTTLMSIAAKYGKTTKQLILRYLIDRGTIPMPHSTNEAHIKENIDIFDFRLSSEEIYLINEYNKNEPVYAVTIRKILNTIFNFAYGCSERAFFKRLHC